MPDYFILGLNHKTAPVELREKLHFRDEEIGPALKSILKLTSIDEIMILSTCNRVELIGVGARVEKLRDILTHFFWKVKSVHPDELSGNLYNYQRSEAISHMFRVASSLDSLVIGEPQILGQLKQALKVGQEIGTVGKHLNQLLTEALHVAKKVRTSTKLAKNAVSVGYVAVEMARKMLGDLSRCQVLVIGTGKMSTLALKHLTKFIGAGELFVTNRTRGTAEQTARTFHGTVIPYDQLYEHLKQIQIILTSTASSDYILDYEKIRTLMAERPDLPLLIIDIAVPRDVDPRVKSLPGVFLYDIDDLREVISQNLNSRLKEAEKAEKIIIREVNRFQNEIQSATVKPMIISLRNHLEGIRSDEMKKHVKELTKMSHDDRATLEHITRAIIKSIMHNPLCSLKTDLIMSDSHIPPLEVFEKIFGLGKQDSLVCEEEEN